MPPSLGTRLLAVLVAALFFAGEAGTSGLDAVLDHGNRAAASAAVPHVEPGTTNHHADRWWDFWFYLAFGVTVTFSVPIAGVLLVFSFLVVPALTAVLFARTPRRMMPIAWSTGMVACLTGLVVSYAYDLPTGPLVVCMFGLVPALAALVRRFILPVPLTEPIGSQGGAGSP